jgi:hypothetical protein
MALKNIHPKLRVNNIHSRPAMAFSPATTFWLHTVMIFAVIRPQVAPTAAEAGPSKASATPALNVSTAGLYLLSRP